jgi:hypothetical protein
VAGSWRGLLQQEDELANVLKSRDRVLLSVVGLAVVTIVAVAVAAYFSPPADKRSPLAGPYDDATCNALAAIATDPQKVSYIRWWFAKRTQNAKFMYELNEDESFMPNQPRTLEQIDLDWKYLGLNPKWKAASFNFRGSKPVTADRVKSITLYQGRSEVTIGMSADGDLGFDPQPVTRMKSFNNNVFVLCGYD